MENKKNTLIIILVIIIAILCITIGWLLGSKFVNTEKEILDDSKPNIEENNPVEEGSNEIITTDMLYGTYTWEKKYINESGNELNLKIKLVLNSDGSATYNASSGYEEEATKGSFVYEDGKIKYTREYFNYSEQDSNTPYNEDNYKVETFIVIDKDTLQNTYYNNATSLTKQK